MNFYKLRHIIGFKDTREEDSCYDLQSTLDALPLLTTYDRTRSKVGPSSFFSSNQYLTSICNRIQVANNLSIRSSTGLGCIGHSDWPARQWDWEQLLGCIERQVGLHLFSMAPICTFDPLCSPGPYPTFNPVRSFFLFFYFSDWSSMYYPWGYDRAWVSLHHMI